MLRRRILASAMASVMALTSVAVVASADETEAAVKNVKSKADLEELVKSFETFRNKDIDDYGSISGERFQDAIDYAENVLNDVDSTVDDYTVAYLMLDEVYNRLKIYSADELKALIDSSTKIYETYNILNEELGDTIYTEDSFAIFQEKFEDAERVVTSGDGRLITDAYEELDAAKSGLVAKASVTKSQFRTALKNYEAVISKFQSYETWRRGSFTGWADLNSGKYWALTADSVHSFGDLIYIIQESGAVYINAYAWGDTVVSASTADTDFWKYNSTQEIEYTTSIEDIINNAYDSFDNIKTATKTTDDDIVAAYQSAVDAVTIFNGWTADSASRGSKASVQKLLTQYHSQLVAKYRTTAAENLYKEVNGTDEVPENWQDLNSNGQYISPSLKNDTKKTQSILITDGYAQFDADDNFVAGTTTQKISPSVDVLKYVDVTSADVEDGSTLQNALEIAEAYLNGDTDAKDGSAVAAIDENDTVVNATGSSAAEWALVYRYLLYALQDEFPGEADETYTKSEVSALIDDAYDLADLTGDAQIFAELHQALVNQRQSAVVWVRAANADKTYKNGNVPTTDTTNRTSTKVYLDLKNAYDALNTQLAAYAYSYEDIYNKIADVADLIDSEELEATDALVNALKDTAYYLSIVDPRDEEEGEDNAAFTTDREFNGYNRLKTDAYDYNKDSTALNPSDTEVLLKSAYEALLAAVKAQTETTALLGDVDGNGKVDAFDAAAILKAVVDGQAIELTVGDFNADGKVDAFDAAAILKAVVDGTV